MLQNHSMSPRGQFGKDADDADEKQRKAPMAANWTAVKPTDGA